MNGQQAQMSIYFVQYLNNKHSKYNRYKVKTTGCHTHNLIFQKLLYLRNSAYSHIYSKERRINALCTSGAICHAEFSTLSFEKYIKKKKFLKTIFKCFLTSNLLDSFFLHICPFVTRFVIFVEKCRSKFCL